tara:strand:- start:203 stop:463 length:261 start_codon:yes stop_codon:yes gene_type:complete
MSIEIIRKKNSHQTIMKVGDEYVLISETGPELTEGFVEHPETLAFLCDEDGNVESWTALAGGSMMQTHDVIMEISQYGINKRGAFQ